MLKKQVVTVHIYDLRSVDLKSFADGFSCPFSSSARYPGNQAVEKAARTALQKLSAFDKVPLIGERMAFLDTLSEPETSNHLVNIW